MDLGELYYKLGIQDNTDADLQKIKQKIAALSAKVSIDVEASKNLQASIDAIISGAKTSSKIQADIDTAALDASMKAFFASHNYTVTANVQGNFGGSGNNGNGGSGKKTMTDDERMEATTWRAIYTRIVELNAAIDQVNQRKINGLLDPNEAQNTINSLTKIRDYLNNLYTVRGDSNKQLAQTFLNSFRLTEAQSGFEQLNAIIGKCEQAIASLAAKDVQGKLGMDGADMQRQFQDLIAQIEKFRDGGLTNVLNANQIRAFASQFTNLANQTKVATAADAEDARQRKISARDAEKEQKAMNDVINVLAKLTNMQNRINTVTAKGSALGADLTQIQRATQLYQQLVQVMNDPALTGRQKMGMWSGPLKAVRTEIQGCITEQTKLNNETARLAREAEKSGTKAASHVRNLRTELQRTAQETGGLARILEGLKPIIGDAFSIYAVQRFLNQVVAVGGEIQKQRLALGHILGNDSNANALFGQMKDLAVKSPFGLLDLMQNARQLSAFGVEYNKLYDTMKRLSDVAAGLGIQFGRLSLAYGETMERGFLDGKLVRQFSYMGLPILQEIAKYYTEINKAGNGSLFSAMDVRKMVSKREVSFEDVDAVIQRMTDAGGKFANMQEVMAESVAGKWKNVKDAIDILYSDIAEGNSELLKAPAEIIMTVIRNYEQFEAILAVVAMRLVGARAASFAYTTAMGQQLAATQAELLAQRQATVAAEMRKRAIQGYNISQLNGLALSKAITAQELKDAILKKQINAAEARYIALRSGVTRANAAGLLQYRLITQAEYDLVMANHALGASYGTMVLKLKAFGIQCRLVVAQLRMMLAAMATNPMTWITIAVAGLMQLLFYIIRVNDEQQKIKDGMNERWHNMRDDAIEIEPHVTVKKNASVAEYQTAIEQLTKFIRDDVPGSKDILDKAFAVDANTKEYQNSLEERYRILKEYYDKVKALAEDNSELDIQEAVQAAFDSHWWAPNDSIITDAADYEKNYKNAKDNLVNAIANGNKELQAYLAEWRKLLNVDNDSKLIEQLLIPANSKKLDSFVKDPQFKNNISFGSSIAVPWSVKNLKSDYDEYVNELDSCMSDLEKRLKVTYEEDFSFLNMTEDQKMSVEYEIRSYLDSSEASDWTKEHMVDYFNTKWHLDISVGGDVDEANTLLQSLYGKKVTVGKQDNISDVIEAARKQYKEANGKLATLKQDKKYKKASSLGLVGLAGLDVTKEDERELKEFTEHLNSVQKELANAKYVLDREGVSYDDPSKNKSKKDALLEQMKNRLDKLKDAYSEFEKWSKSLGKEGAGKKIKEALGLDDNTIKDVSDPKAYLNAIKEFEKKIAGFANGSEQRKKFLESVRKLGLDVELKINNDEVTRFANDLKDKLSEASKRSDVFKAWFDVTGDRDQSMKIALNVQPVWNDKNRMLLDAFNEKALKFGIMFTEENFPMYDKSMLDELFTGEKAGLKEAYIQVRDAFRDGGYEAAKILANSLKDLRTSTEELLVAKDEYDKAVAADKQLTGGKNADRLKAQYDVKELRLSDQYRQFFNNYLNYTNTEINAFAEDIKNKLGEAFKRGGITAQKYNEEIKKIDETMEKFRKNQHKIWGVNQSTDDYLHDRYSKGQQMKNEGSAAYEKAAAEGNTKAMDAAQKMVQKGEGMMKGADKMQNAMDTVGTVIKTINSAVQAMKDIINSVCESLDALGVDVDETTSIGMAKAEWNIFAESSQHATNSFENFKSGNFAGMASEMVQSVTSVVTGIAKFHDAVNQRLIESNERQSKILGNIHSLLERRLERTMGGIYSIKTIDDETKTQLQFMRLISSFKQLGVVPIGYSRDTAAQAKKALESNSYFDTQLALLMGQRDKMMENLVLEQNKSNSDDSAIEDYKQQLAELEDQVQYFAEDLAKSLYDIDFKSWAQQLTDAVVEAWAKGEDAARAYEDTVHDIMKGVFKSYAAQAIMEAALKPVLDDFTTAFANNKGKLSPDMVASLTNNLLVAGEEASVVIAQMAQQLKDEFNVDLGETGQSSLSGSIQNISEETADLLASYLNGMRSDLSIHKENFARFMKDYMGEGRPINVIAEAQLAQLNAIAQNTANTVSAIDALNDRIDNITNGNSFVHIR